MLPKLVYDQVAARDMFGFWADFIAPTAACEGGNFLTLNTYDRARFTWGFAQFGAHVPDGDFVHFFRDLLLRPEAQDYFPNLAVRSGRISKIGVGKEVALEDAKTTKPLMDYLNPSTQNIEDTEVIAAAKFVHWTTHHEDVQSLQVFHTVAVFRRLMNDADGKLNLDGKGADLCMIICDIRHQGRAKYPAMQAALASPNPQGALLALGSIAYPERIKVLRKELIRNKNEFSGKKWSRSAGAFI
ncbi:hypothetical protein FF100_13140 [Methylobacterium terricola]|uniref:Uncharacterized protein n=1 Tax=Methylobacterium terricola TaxID=2583531 RepID=A0A5C4LJA4_9HYPH|nr:hypothetical protein [Methylobacterium terricola]TNC13703.1 hypothetical protein FF100_13140 [Methylobacterium terricola]